jgi:hypothetical protein
MDLSSSYEETIEKVETVLARNEGQEVLLFNSSRQSQSISSPAKMLGLAQPAPPVPARFRACR